MKPTGSALLFEGYEPEVDQPRGSDLLFEGYPQDPDPDAPVDGAIIEHHADGSHTVFGHTPPGDTTQRGAAGLFEGYEPRSQALGFLDAMSEAFNPTEGVPGSGLAAKIPVIGAGFEAADLYDLIRASNRFNAALDAGQEPDAEDQAVLAALARHMQKEKSFGYTVGSILAHGPTFMAEMLMGGGVAQVGKAGLRRVVGEGVEQAARRALERSLGRKLAAGAAKAGTVGATIASQTALVGGGGELARMLNVPGVEGGAFRAKALQMAMPDVLLTVDEATGLETLYVTHAEEWVDKMPAAVRDTLYEVASEHAGGLTAGLFGAFAATASRWIKLKPGRTMGQFIEKAKKAGLHDPFSEVAEEYLGATMRAADPGLEETWRDIWTGWEDFGAMLTAFSVMQGSVAAAGAGAGLAMDRAGNLAGEFRQPLQTHEIPTGAGGTATVTTRGPLPDDLRAEVATPTTYEDVRGDGPPPTFEELQAAGVPALGHEGPIANIDPSLTLEPPPEAAPEDTAEPAPAETNEEATPPPPDSPDPAEVAPAPEREQADFPPPVKVEKPAAAPGEPVEVPPEDQATVRAFIEGNRKALGVESLEARVVAPRTDAEREDVALLEEIGVRAHIVDAGQELPLVGSANAGAVILDGSLNDRARRLQVVVHELQHVMARADAQGFDSLQRDLEGVDAGSALVRDLAKVDPKLLEKARRAYRKEFRAAGGRSLSLRAEREEGVAVTGEVLAGLVLEWRRAPARMHQLASREPGIVRRVVDAIGDLLRRITRGRFGSTSLERTVREIEKTFGSPGARDRIGGLSASDAVLASRVLAKALDDLQVRLADRGTEPPIAEPPTDPPDPEGPGERGQVDTQEREGEPEERREQESESDPPAEEVQPAAEARPEPTRAVRTRDRRTAARARQKKRVEEWGALSVVNRIRVMGGVRTAQEPELWEQFQHHNERKGVPFGVGNAVHAPDSGKGADPDEVLEALVGEGFFPGRELGDLSTQDLIEALEENRAHPGEDAGVEAYLERERTRAESEGVWWEEQAELEAIASREAEGLGVKLPEDPFAVDIRAEDVPFATRGPLHPFPRTPDGEVRVPATRIAQEGRRARFMKFWVDRMHPWNRLQRAIENGKRWTLNEELDARTAIELRRGVTRKRLLAVREKHQKPIVELLKRNKIPLDMAGLYLASRHAPERNAHIQELSQGRNVSGSGMTTPEAERVRAQFENGPKGKALLELAERFNALNAETRQGWVEDGLMSNEDVAAMEARYQNWAPLWDSLPEGLKGSLRIGRGLDIRGTEAKRAVGRAFPPEAQSILPIAMAEVERSIVRGEKNKVGQKVFRLLRMHNDEGLYLVDPPELKRTVVEVKPKDGGDPYETIREVYAPEIASSANVFSVKIHGEEHHILFHDRHADIPLALMGMDQEELNVFLDYSKRLLQFFAAMVTRWDPVFPVANLFRDVGSGTLTTVGEHGAALGARVFMGVPAAITGLARHKLAKEGAPKTGILADVERYEASGAEIAFLDVRGVEDMGINLQREIESVSDSMVQLRPVPATVATLAGAGLGAIVGGPMGAAVGASTGATAASLPRLDGFFKAWAELFGGISDIVENSTRFAYFRAVTRPVEEGGLGWSDKRAAIEAKGLTTNFEKKGNVAGVLSSWWMFANAGIQGNLRTLESMTTLHKDGGARLNAKGMLLVAGVASMGFALAAWNRAMSGEDDDGENFWDKEPAYKKRNYIMIAIPGRPGEFATIPAPFVWNWFWGMGQITEARLHNAQGRWDGLNTTDAWLESISLSLETFNPMGGDWGQLDAVAPTFLQPFIQSYANRNWAGFSIMPPWLVDESFMPESSKFFDSVSPEWVRLSRWLNRVSGGNEFESGIVDISPETFEHFAGFLSGGVGRTVGRATDAIAGIFTDEEVPLHRIPLARRFYSTPNPGHVRTRFYDNLDELSSLQRQVEGRDLSGASPEVRAERGRENRSLLEARAGIQRANREITGLRKELDADPGTARAAEIAAEIDQIMRRANRSVAEAKQADIDRRKD